MNMKKVYIKPELAQTEFQPVVEMLQASTFGPKPGDEYTEDDEAGSKEREDGIVEEGVWGNLW